MNRLAFVLKGYPRLSETFISQEIRALEIAGIKIDIFSLRKPTDKFTHNVHKKIKAPISYLPEYLHREPLRVFKSWTKVRHLKGYKTAFKIWISNLIKDPSRNRIRRFGQAMVLANELPKNIQHIHSHFLHTPTTVAFYASKILDLPFSISAHAKDIWTTPLWDIKEKISECNWIVTCTSSNQKYLSGLTSKKIQLVYHGINFENFPQQPNNTSTNSGKHTDIPIVILSVGRLVEKKGYNILLKSLANLPYDLNWSFEHAGTGPLGKELRQQAKELHIEDRILWHGPLPQNQILQLYQKADIFVLASIVANNGDRDGLPNVLMEAQSQSLPCICSNIPGAKELIAHNETGLIVEQNSIQDLTDTITTLIKQPAKRLKIGKAGEKRIRQYFSLNNNISYLINLFNSDCHK